MHGAMDEKLEVRKFILEACCCLMESEVNPLFPMIILS